MGEILVRQETISEEQLREALRVQGEDGRNLGRILVSLGYMTEEDLGRTISSQFDLDYVADLESEVDPAVIEAVPRDVLEQHGAMPLRIEGGRLIVAMTDPGDLYARSDLTISAGIPVTAVVATEDSIRAAHGKFFGGAAAPDPFETGAAPDGGREQRRAGAGRKAKVGDILLSEGMLTQGQLDSALAIQKSDPRDVGEILISLGYVGTEDVARATAKRLGLDFVVLSELSESEVDPEILRVMSEENMRKYMALPLRVEHGHMVVAMSNPDDLFALEDLRIILKRRVLPVVASADDIEGAISHLFGEGEVETPFPFEEDLSDEESGAESAEALDHGVEAEPDPVGAPDIPSGTPSRRRRLRGDNVGDILVSEGKISTGQLEEAIALQRENRGDLGQILLSLGYVSKTELARAVAARLRLEYVEITESDVDRAIASMVDQRVLRKYTALPLRVENGRLIVAMSDPSNIHALEDLMMISGHPVTPVVAVEEEIRSIHNKVFAMGEGVTEILQEAASESATQDAGEIDLGMQAGEDDAPVIRLVSSILQQAVGESASDVHVEPRANEVTVRFRVDGVLRELMSIPTKLQRGVIARLKVMSNLNIAEHRIPQDGRFSVRLAGQKVDFRVASLPTVYGEKLVLRLLDSSSTEVNLEKLGFAPHVIEKYREIFNRPYGAILVTGPTGSGKSTTLYATLSELNSPEKNIITVEDPVELRVAGVNQIQVNPKAGLTFASGLRSILRADPDIVMIGEIRDFETAKISVEAALTGHLVLATLHTNDAPGALGRLTDMGVEPFLTASAVDCVIAQRLARRLCSACKQPVEVEEEVLSSIRFPFEHVEGGNYEFHKAVGCNRCGGSGYRGRLGIYELMVVDEEIRELMLRRASGGEISRAAEAGEMIRLREDGLIKASQGMTSIEEVLRTVV